MKSLLVFASSFFVMSLALGASHQDIEGKTNYENAYAAIDQVVKNNPDVLSWQELGKNDQGKSIWMVRAEKPISQAKANRLVVASHHGNEVLSVDVAIQFIKDLVEEFKHPKYGTAGDHVYYVVPALNISGYNAQRREEVNAKGESIDPNRDYPDPCVNPRPWQLKSTKALADFMRAKSVTAVVTIHGYIGTFTYPWGTYAENTHTADHNAFDAIGTSAVKENGYQTGTHADVIYPTVGAFEDWAYFELGAWAFLLELDNSPNIQNDSRALLRMFSEVPAVASVNHSFTGKCRNMVRTEIKARP